MGAIWMPRIELVTTASEIVGHKAGIALNRTDLRRLLKDEGEILEGADHQLLRVRSEEFEEIVARLLYSVGNIPSPSIGPPISTVYHKYKDDEALKDVFLDVAGFLPTFLNEGLAGVKAGKAKEIDPRPFLDEALRRHGRPGAAIALDLLRQIDLQMHRSPWSQYRRKEWKDTAELQELFQSESLSATYGTFFDQRFIDYLATQFEDIDKINWRKFEGLACEFFDRRGFHVEIGPGRDDGNIDARVWPKEQDPSRPPTILVQCKRQKLKVDKVVVKALWADIQNEKAESGLIVTTACLSPGARKVCTARAYPISQVDRSGLIKWLTLMRIPGNGIFLGE